MTPVARINHKATINCYVFASLPFFMGRMPVMYTPTKVDMTLSD